MKNEFTAIIERNGDWYIAYVLRFLAQMGRLEPRMKLGKI
jgi:hypothetical protein